MANPVLMRARHRSAPVANASEFDKRAISRAAREMVNSHGERAEAVATKRAANLELSGMTSSATTWRLIARAVEEMTATAARGAETDGARELKDEQGPA